MSKKLRWGLLSTARITKAVIPPIKALERHELSAVASRSKESAEAFAAKWDIPRTFDSYDALLADPDIDVVYIPLPNAMHADWVVKAADAGKHVLCEKPLATSLEDVDRIIAARDRNNVVIAEAFMYLHHPRTKLVKRMIDDGEIGKLRMIKGSFSFPLEDSGNVRLKPELGGGCLWDVGCYPLSFANYLAGSKPSSVSAHQILESGVDVWMSAQMVFSNDVVAQIDSSFRCQFRMKMGFIGEAGVIKIDEAFKPEEKSTIDVFPKDGPPRKVEVTADELYSYEIEDMAKAIIDGEPQGLSLEDSRDNIETILKVYRSAKAES